MAQSDNSALIRRVTSAFLILHIGSITDALDALAENQTKNAELIRDVSDGLRSVLSAATLPFQLAFTSVQQRRFDRFLSAERIRSLKDVPAGDEPSAEIEIRSLKLAKSKMAAFMESAEGADFLKDAVVKDLEDRLSSITIAHASNELMVQALIATWAVFEHFAQRYIICKINADPSLAKGVLSVPELKGYFGKQAVDFDAISEHGFDLSGSMGELIFRGKRLDNLGVIRHVIGKLVDTADVATALGDDLWLLNQRRHLFIHKRGVVDTEYIKRTGDSVKIGDRLKIDSEDVERYLYSVQQAVILIASQ